jgi:hypothetical protein
MHDHEQKNNAKHCVNSECAHCAIENQKKYRGMWDIICHVQETSTYLIELLDWSISKAIRLLLHQESPNLSGLLVKRVIYQSF